MYIVYCAHTIIIRSIESEEVTNKRIGEKRNNEKQLGRKAQITRNKTSTTPTMSRKRRRRMRRRRRRRRRIGNGCVCVSTSTVCSHQIQYLHNVWHQTMPMNDAWFSAILIWIFRPKEIRESLCAYVKWTWMTSYNIVYTIYATTITTKTNKRNETKQNKT